MCTLLIGYKVHPAHQLVVAANRDEFYERPTERVHQWPEAPSLLAGRDILAGGTWLGVTKTSRFAAITNYRDLKNIKPDAPSRGALPLNFLQGDMSAATYLESLQPTAHLYNGYNLVVYDGQELAYYGNYADSLQGLAPGVYGLSNALLDTPWPKVRDGKRRFAEYLAHSQRPTATELLALLNNPATYPEAELPDTGVGLERERMLSALLIQSEKYGTCCSTALLLGQQQIELAELNTNPLRADRALVHVSLPIR